MQPPAKFYCHPLWYIAFTCALAGCATPYSTPDSLPISGLPNGAINLQGPIVVVPAERTQGGWAQGILQSNANLSPAVDELTRLSQPLDLLFGEPLTDATWFSPQMPTLVKNPSVIFQIPISFTDTGLDWTGPDYECSTGGICVPDYVSDGKYGVYMARAEVCLSSADQPSGTPVKGGDGNPVSCSVADGIQDNRGYWYDIAPAWKATATLSARNGQTTYATLSVPAQLPAPTNVVRIELALGLSDAANGGGIINDLYWGDLNGWSSSAEHAMTRFAMQFPPIKVMPAAFVQLKVLPYTILYRPPGDLSSGTYTATEAYATTMTIGSNTAIGNRKGFESAYGVSDGEKITALVGSIQLADKQSQTQTVAWDSNSIIGTGLAVGGSHTVARSFTVGSTSSSPDLSVLPAHEYVVPNTCVPGNYNPSTCLVKPPEVYSQEPFWGDRFVLMLDPQLAIWDFNGTPGTQLLGAAEFAEVAVRDLDACSRNTDPNAWQLTKNLWLTPDECKELLALDPFYRPGQRTNPEYTGRALHVGGGSYGRDPLNPSSPFTQKFSDIFKYEVAKTTYGTSSYKASVTDVIGFSWSEGLGLSYQTGAYGLNVGFTSNVDISRGEKLTTGSTMQIAYSASTIATDTKVTQIDGIFSDDHDFYTPACQQNSGKCYTPHVEVFIDELFGSYMFQDPDAGCNIHALGCLNIPIVPGVVH